MRAVLEGNRVNRISVRGVAVASATAVTAVGAVVGVASGSETTQHVNEQPTADVAGSTLLADIPSGAQAQTVSDNISRQADAQQTAAEAAAQKAAAEAARQKAAAAAQAKQDAAQKAAAAKAAAEEKAKQEAAAKAAARAALSQDFSVSGIQSIAQSIIGDSSQFQCFSWIVSHESGWNYKATNASTGAYGLVQALPGSKMASEGSDWQTNPTTQIKWGLSYMNSRYGSPCAAQSFWEAHNWY
jgi:hypothetical protein